MAKDIVLVEQYMPRRMPDTHQKRLENQERGDVLYLVAWFGGVPIGHLLLKWGASEGPTLVLPNCPILSDIAVHPAHQSQGIGSQMIDVAEHLAAQRGCRQVSLGVALDNVRAHAVYERCGYRDSGLGTYCSRWPYLDEQGQEQWREELCIRLIKPLVEQSC